MSSSQTPAWVEDLNTIGDNVGGAESLISLDGDSLLETARKRTGCEDFGGESWREPFSIRGVVVVGAPPADRARPPAELA